MRSRSSIVKQEDFKKSINKLLNNNSQHNQTRLCRVKNEPRELNSLPNQYFCFLILFLGANIWFFLKYVFSLVTNLINIQRPDQKCYHCWINSWRAKIERACWVYDQKDERYAHCENEEYAFSKHPGSQDKIRDDYDIWRHHSNTYIWCLATCSCAI